MTIKELDITVDNVLLKGVRFEIEPDGDFRYTIPDVIDRGDTLQQVSIEDGVSDPVKKTSIAPALQEIATKEMGTQNDHDT